MSEEERRRCIIMGACGATSQAGGGDAARLAALNESIGELPDGGELAPSVLVYILGLIDEARHAEHHGNKD